MNIKLMKELSLVIVCLVIFLGLLFHKVFFDPFVYFTADTAELYFPWWQWTHRMVLQGYFPILNREWFGGSMPFAALETEVFYPVYWFFNLLVPPANLHADYLSYLVYELFHYVLGGLGFYLFCRLILKLSSYASLFGSIVFIGSGAYMARFVHPGSVFPMAYYPWLLSGFFQYMRTNKWRYFLWSVISLAMIVVSGHPHVVYFILIGLAGTILFHGLGDISALKKGLSILVVGLLLASIKLLPLIEASMHLVRLNDTATSATLFNSVSPLYFLTMIVPTLFGRHQQDLGYWGTEFIFGSWENYLYIGIIPLLLLPFSLHIAGPAVRQPRLTSPAMYTNYLTQYLWLFTGIFGLLLLGNYFPLSAFILKHLPFSSSLGVFTKIHLLFHFYIVCLSAVGMQKLIEHKYYSKMAFISIFIVGLILAYFVFNPHVFYTLQPAGRGLQSLTSFDAIYKSTVINIVFFLIAIGMFGLIKKKTFNSFVLSILLLITISDFVIYHKDFHPIIDAYPSPQAFYGELNNSEFLTRDKSIFRVLGEKPRNSSMVYGFESVSGYHTVVTDAYTKSAKGLEALDPQTLNRANVKYVYSNEDLSTKGNFVQLKDTLWENKDVLPRVFHEHGDVTILSYTPNTLTAEVNVHGNGNLFLSEFQYPGWKIKIDGTQRELQRANSAFYSLPLKIGKHSIEFYYQSDSLMWGWSVTILTSIGIVILTLLHYKDWKLLRFRRIGESSE